MVQTIGTIPEFTSDETEVPKPIQEEVKEEATPTEPQPEEKETPAPPAEKPDEPVVESSVKEEEYQRAVQGLQAERVRLLKEISDLKGNKRELKEEKLAQVQEQIAELKDLHPDDVATIERVLRAKGMLTKQEVDKMFYESVKNEELTKFLEKYPEYKPENDPGDVNWNLLQRELEYYRTPSNPRDVNSLLERAHKGVIRVPSNPSISSQRQQVRTASVGGGGSQRSTSTGKLDTDMKSRLKGFSEEEIQSMERKLNS